MIVNILLYSMYKVSNIVGILNGIIVYCMQTSYWFFKTVYTSCVPASDMNNFQFIFNNEQSMSFHFTEVFLNGLWLSLYSSSIFSMYLRRNLMRRCAFCSFCLPSCHVQHSPGFFSQISSECFAEFLDILINFHTTMLLAIF